MGFRFCVQKRKAPEIESIHRKMAGLHPVFCGELVTGYPCIPLLGNATKGAFRAGGADRNRTSGGSRLLRAGVQRTASSLCWVQGCSALLGSRGAGRRWRPLRQSRKSTDRRGAETKSHWRVEGSQPHRVKGETPCPGRVDALRQFVLGILPDAEIRRFGGFAAAPLREKSTENGGMKIETDTAQRTLRQAWHL